MKKVLIISKMTVVTCLVVVMAFMNMHLTVLADAPTVDIKIEGNDYAEIGQEVTYRATVKLVKGADNVKLEITIPEGLTSSEDRIQITYGEDPATSVNVLLGVPSYTTNPDGSVSYQVSFPNGMQGTVNVECKATINENARACEEQKISATVSYGQTEMPITSAPAERSFYTYGFDLKVNTGKQESLDGASFTLHREDNGASRYYKDPSDDNNICELRFAPLAENESEPVFTTDGDGKICFNGLTAGNYILKQTASAAGYEILSDPLTITIGEDGALSVTGETVDSNLVSNVPSQMVMSKQLQYGTLTLVNNAEILSVPATGGSGTAAFYLGGGILLFVAGLLLVYKFKYVYKAW